ncbi:hypothetical protein LOTGIDRAFT_228380 [Lottia gigantea]|uniref:Uncharacterized protein n=1 Tax=Lottia gigantea TaxID=225164 RepID=V4AL20_LOTGI|nr:hypothetical protein LOTGIDRAFT_228380 [Lottia gigantea]ESO97827.1 hypothetical protein LOTGIDRAFT_228380 [Lottia gigantea]
MERVGLLAILAICLVLANCKYIEADVNRIVDKLGLDFVEIWQAYVRSYDNLELAAKFNINGNRSEKKKVVKRWFILYTHNSVDKWVRSESLQLVTYYLDGSSPIKVTTLHENGTMEVMYIGSLLDKRCEILNCQYEFIQPVGSTMKEEIFDAEGWAVISAVTSPGLEGSEGLSIIFDSELTCSL